MNKKQIDEMLENEAVSKFFLRIGKVFKDMWMWAWNLDGDDILEYFAGSLIIFIVASCGLGGLFGLGVIFWATFNVSWLWIFSWPPAIGLTLILEARVVKGIIEIYKDFFRRR
jgi:hypothetical protein